MSELDIKKILSVSTGHITREDNDRLQSGVLCSQLAYDPIEYGFLIWVGDDDEIIGDMKGQLEDDGFAPELHELLLLARKNDCLYVYLDRDGFLVEGLNSYDW